MIVKTTRQLQIISECEHFLFCGNHVFFDKVIAKSLIFGLCHFPHRHDYGGKTAEEISTKFHIPFSNVIMYSCGKLQSFNSHSSSIIHI